MSLESDELKRERYFRQTEKNYEKKVANIFKDALDDIRVSMAKIYDKYAIDGILTKAQMTQYNRLVALEDNIKEIIKPAARTSIKIIDRLRPEEYGEAFFRTGWAIDNESGVSLSWGALNKDSVVDSLSNPFFDSSKKSFWFNANNRIRNSINNGLAVGQSYPEMMRDLKDMVNVDAFEIMRVLRTELHSAQEYGTAAAYDSALEHGIKGRVVWISTLDGRTRPDHQAMDGKYRDDDGMFHGAIGEAPYPGWEGLPAGERINCRCSIRFELEGYEPQLRLSRDEGIIPYQTYEEWANDKKFWK